MNEKQLETLKDIEGLPKHVDVRYDDARTTDTHLAGFDCDDLKDLALLKRYDLAIPKIKKLAEVEYMDLMGAQDALNDIWAVCQGVG